MGIACAGPTRSILFPCSRIVAFASGSRFGPRYAVEPTIAVYSRFALISRTRVVGLSEGITGMALSAAIRIMACPRVIASGKGACKKHMAILLAESYRRP
jgi:hypothetical protein